MPELTIFPPSSQPVIIEYCKAQETNPQTSTHSLKNSSEILRKQLKNVPSSQKYPAPNPLTSANNAKKSRISTLTSQPNLNPQILALVLQR